MKNVNKNKLCTPAYFNFLDENINTYRIAAIVEIFIDNFDIIKNSLITNQGHTLEITKSILSEFDNRTKLNKFSQDVNKIVLIRLVDNFNTYLSEVINLIITVRPEILKTSDKIEIEKVLSFSSIEEFRLYLFEKKVNSLSNQGFSKIVDFLKDKIRLNFIINENDNQLLIKAVDIRNLFVHKRGVVDNKYLDKNKEIGYQLGQVINITIEELKGYTNSIENTVRIIEDAVLKKFGDKIQQYLSR